MAQEIATSKTDNNMAIYESLALRGDISGLKPAERVRYYAELCNRLGLDPLTQPFIPLRLNNKEVLYASRAATDQLARIHSLRREVLSRETVQDVYIVTVRATLPDGRAEDAIGAVSIAGAKGEALANALMRCETKAKRRATLAILGLGVLDESELETIPPAAFQDSTPAPEPEAPRMIRAGVAGINGEQRARLAKLIRELTGHGVALENLKGKMADLTGAANSADLTAVQAEDVIGVFAQWAAHLQEAAEANAKAEAEDARKAQIQRHVEEVSAAEPEEKAAMPVVDKSVPF
jgi:hypothetical protein